MLFILVCVSIDYLESFIPNAPEKKSSTVELSIVSCGCQMNRQISNAITIPSKHRNATKANDMICQME